MSQNPLNHKHGQMMWVWVLLWALMLGVGCSQGSDGGDKPSVSDSFKLMGARAEASQPETHEAAKIGETKPVKKPSIIPLKQLVSATSQEVMGAIGKQFEEQESLLFLHSAHPENEYVVVGFPGRLLVAPDTSTLEKVLANQPPRVTVKVHPDAIASILADTERPSAAIMDSNDTLVGLVATEKIMLRLRRSAVVAAPQPTENQAGKEAAKAIITTAASVNGSPSSEHSAAAVKAPVLAATLHNEASETDSHATVPDEADTAHGPQKEKSVTHSDVQHQTEAVDTHAAADTTTSSEEGGHHGAPASTFDDQMPTGIAFVDSAIKPMTYELEDRFWGWRPNDLVRITDNVNHFQLGVLEVTRRTAVMLAQRISRTGITAAFDPNLEKAMNWFMIKADRFWLPSAESKYRDGIEEWEAYRERLLKNEAAFFNRADNLIPLLTAYEDLLGSCEENLVKVAEDDGSPVSYFSSDNYFYYTQGVISAMVTILEAVGYDFKEILTSRRADADLHHAISSCEHALHISPVVVFNSAPSSIFANHRANLAAPVSHARFFIGVLIKTLST